MIATLVTGLVIEAMRKIESVFIGVVLLDVLEADGVEIDGLAFACDEGDDAAHFLAIDKALHRLVQALEAIAGNADARRCYWCNGCRRC